MITAEQKEARRRYVGSSDAAAILGLSPYANAEDIRLDKLGRLEEWKGNAATEVGTYLEPAIRAWAADKLDAELLGDKMFVHPNGIMAANLDGYDPSQKIVVEVKTSGIVGPPNQGYGIEEAGEVPDIVAVQVQHQLACTRYVAGYVAALIGGHGFKLFRIERDDAFIAGLEKTLCQFWHNHVLADVPAPQVMPGLDTLKRYKRQPKKTVDIRNDPFQKYLEAETKLAATEAEFDTAKAALLTELGDAEAGMLDGQIVLTYMANKNGHRRINTKQPKGAA
jgi:putative phage-type endonuclease